MMRVRSAIGEVRGLGSARSGAHGWWMERLTSVSTLILFVWLLVSLLRLPALDRETVVEWLATPIAAVPMLLLVISTFWHLHLGLKVIVEDYVHEEGNKIFTLIVLNFLVLGGAALALFSILKIAFGGGAA